MKSYDLFDIIGDIDDDYILEAKKENLNHGYRKKYFVAGIAASVVGIIGLATVLGTIGNMPNKPSESLIAADIPSTTVDNTNTVNVETSAASSVIETIDEINEDPDYKATQAHKLLFSTFKDAPGGPVYPEDFCGDYVEDGKLHVILTNTSVETVEKYRGLTGNSDAVVFETGDISLEEMFKLQDDIWDYYSEMELSPNIAYVDQINKVLKIGFDEDDLDEAQKWLQEYLYDNHLEYYLDDICLIAEGGSKPEVSLYGGSQLYKNNYLNRTLALSGHVGSNVCLLTCGHGNTSVYDLFTGSTGTSYGRVVYVRYTNGGYGDFSIIQAESNISATPRVWTGNGGYVTITSTLDIPAVGSTVYKYGMTTGQSSATINATNVTVNTGSIEIKGLVRASSSTASAAGDSGGPYRQGTYFCGVHHGSLATDSNTIFFTPYYYIRTSSYSFGL